MARTVHQVNIFVNDKMVDTHVLIDKGGNHAVISNKNHVLFDGYILEAYKIWDDKMNEFKMLRDAGFLSIEVVR